MDKVTELARAAIGAEHIAIRLVRGEAGELVVIVWPTRATEIEPAALPATTTAIVATLSEARTQLRLIRQAER